MPTAKLQCQECGKEFKGSIGPGAEPKCPKCGGYDVELNEQKKVIEAVRQKDYHTANVGIRKIMEQKVAAAMQKERKSLIAK